MCHSRTRSCKAPNRRSEMSIRTRRNLTRASLREAIEYLASACDGAVRRDGHGFTADDVAIGHRLAHKRRWTRRDQAVAHRIVVHHRRQLENAGIAIKGVTSKSNRRETRLAPACWAADPTRLHRLRYWNGARWTQFTCGRPSGTSSFSLDFPGGTTPPIT